MMPFAVALIMSCSSTRNATTRCTLHNPPKALPAVRTNHLGIDSCYGNASRSSATPAAQHRCTLDRACVKLAMTVVTLCTVAMILMMTSCCPAADSYEIHVVLGATTEVLTVAPHWTAREVTAALEAKTGRSLRGCWLLAPGAKVLRVGKKKARTLGELGVRKDSVLEVRHRVHGGMDAGGAGPSTDFKMPDFEYSTPMLVMPFLQFKAQGRIMKSVQKWRDEALAQGWLVEFKEGEGKVAIFISHTWWDRDFKDETNDASDVYDKGAPDWQSGEKKDLKWRVICAGVERLIMEERLKIVEIKCSQAKEGELVVLGSKMLRPQHVESLMAAVNKYRVTKLNLNGNQLGPKGVAKLAEALQTNTTLTELKLYGRAAWGGRSEDLIL